MVYTYEEICRLFDLYAPVPLPEEQIIEIRKYFGKIPKALENYYRICGGCEVINSAQDYLLTADGRYCYKLQNWNYTDYSVFYVENQCVSEWAIKNSDLENDNPPVYETYDCGKTWYKASDTVSKFLIGHAYLHAAFSFKYTSEEFVEATALHVNEIIAHMPHVDVDSSSYAGTMFFKPYADTILVVMHEYEGNFSLMYSSKIKAHFLETEKQIIEILGNHV